MNSWSLYSHPVLLHRLQDTVCHCHSTAGREGTARMQGNKGEKISHLDQELPCPVSRPPDIIIYVLHPTGDLLMIYWIQPLIFKSLSCSPAQFLHLAPTSSFLLSFRASPASKAQLVPAQSLERAKAPQAQGRATLPWEKLQHKSFMYKLKAKRDRPQRGSTKLCWKHEGTQQG